MADDRILYHNDMSTCAAKVRLVLAEKGLGWEGRHMNLRAGDTHDPEYLKLNPLGVVPTLIDRGHVLIESTVICEYLQDAYPDPPLAPADPFRRARMRLWTKQLDEGVHASTGVVSISIAFRHQHASKTPEELEAHLVSMPDPHRRERLRISIEQGMQSPLFAPAVARFRKLFSDMAGALAESPWLAGEGVSLADLSYAPYVARLEHLGLDALLAEHASVRDWADRLKARPSYQAALVDWFNDGYLAIFERERPGATARLAELMAA